ncbi:MAG: hypothetical protein ACI9TH_004419 [Kiritimatiellia bacterium]|jgi:hypothetical protein
MKHDYTCSIQDDQTLTSLPHSWSEDDYRDLLNFLDLDLVEAIPAAELADMAIMALQDLDPIEASAKVLTNRMSDLLTPGQIKNCSQELREEPLWEEYPEPAAHRRFFVCQDLLSRVFPGTYAIPEARSVTLQVAGPLVGQLHDPIDCETVLRILAQGMDDTAILTRLYGAQLEASGPFSEAECILWDCETLKLDDTGATVRIISSQYWMRGLPDEGRFTGQV